MRDEILKCLGEFPVKTDLNVTVLETIEKPAYIRQLIEYNVEINERVQSYLLIPKEKKKQYPAIVAIHQHASNWAVGKSEVVGLTNHDMYSYGKDLVQKGFVVIAPDLLCFEDRIQENFRKDRETQKAYERFAFCQNIWKGSCLQTKYLNDLTSAVDVLCTLSFVDKENIGAIGHSLGGQEAVWLSWYDNRIKAGVSSCGVSTIASIMDHHILHNFALYVPGLIKICDMDEIISEIMPRSFLCLSGSKDERHFPIRGIRAIEDRVNRKCKELGIEDCFTSIIFDGGHEFKENEKRFAYQWLQQKLHT